MYTRVITTFVGRKSNWKSAVGLRMRLLVVQGSSSIRPQDLYGLPLCALLRHYYPIPIPHRHNRTRFSAVIKSFLLKSLGQKRYFRYHSLIEVERPILTAVHKEYFRTLETLSTVFVNHRKSLIQHCERSKQDSPFEWSKVKSKCPKWPN